MSASNSELEILNRLQYYSYRIKGCADESR